MSNISKTTNRLKTFCGEINHCCVIVRWLLTGRDPANIFTANQSGFLEHWEGGGRKVFVYEVCLRAGSIAALLIFLDSESKGGFPIDVIRFDRMSLFTLETLWYLSEIHNKPFPFIWWISVLSRMWRELVSNDNQMEHIQVTCVQLLSTGPWAHSQLSIYSYQRKKAFV